MKDRTLTHISMIVAMTGLIILIVLLKFSKIPSLDLGLEKIDNYVGKDVEFKGEITDVKETSGSYQLTILKESEINVLIQKKDEPPETGSVVIVKGTVEEYNGKVFISPKSIYAES